MARWSAAGGELCARRATWSDRAVPPWTRSRADAEGAGPQPTAGRWQSWAFGLLLLGAGLHCLRRHAVAGPLAVGVLAGVAPRAVEAWDRGRSWRPRLLWLAALWLGLGVWVNLHSSALIVPALLGVAAAGGAVDRLLGRAERLA